MSYVYQWKNANKNWLIEFSIFCFIGFEKLGSIVRAIDGLRDEEVCTSFHLAMQIFNLIVHIRWTKIERRTYKEVGGLSDACSGMVNACIETLLDEFDET